MLNTYFVLIRWTIPSLKVSNNSGQMAGISCTKRRMWSIAHITMWACHGGLLTGQQWHSADILMPWGRKPQREATPRPSQGNIPSKALGLESGTQLEAHPTQWLAGAKTKALLATGAAWVAKSVTLDGCAIKRTWHLAGQKATNRVTRWRTTFGI